MHLHYNITPLHRRSQLSFYRFKLFVHASNRSPSFGRCCTSPGGVSRTASPYILLHLKFLSSSTTYHPGSHPPRSSLISISSLGHDVKSSTYYKHPCNIRMNPISIMCRPHPVNCPPCPPDVSISLYTSEPHVWTSWVANPTAMLKPWEWTSLCLYQSISDSATSQTHQESHPHSGPWKLHPNCNMSWCLLPSHPCTICHTCSTCLNDSLPWAANNEPHILSHLRTCAGSRAWRLTLTNQLNPSVKIFHLHPL